MKRLPVLIPILPLPKSLSQEDGTSTSTSTHRQHNPQKHPHPQCPLPYIPLPTRKTESSSSSSVTLGRAKLILTTSSACQCLSLFTKLPLTNQQKQQGLVHTSLSTSSKTTNSKHRGHFRPTCQYCKYLESWVCKYVSKQMITIECIEKEGFGFDANNDGGTDNSHSRTSDSNCNGSLEEDQWIVNCIGQHSKYIVRISNGTGGANGTKNCNSNKRSSTDSEKNKNSNIIQMGSIIQFMNPKYEKSHDKELHENKNCEDSSSQMALSQKQMEFKVDYIVIEDGFEFNGVTGYKGAKIKDQSEKSIEDIITNNNRLAAAAADKHDWNNHNDGSDINIKTEKVVKSNDMKQKKSPLSPPLVPSSSATPVQKQEEAILMPPKTANNTTKCTSPPKALLDSKPPTSNDDHTQEEEPRPAERQKQHNHQETGKEQHQQIIIDLMTPSPSKKRKLNQCHKDEHEPQRVHDDSSILPLNMNEQIHQAEVVSELTNEKHNIGAKTTHSQHQQKQKITNNASMRMVESGHKIETKNDLLALSKNTKAHNFFCGANGQEVIELLSSPESSLSKSGALDSSSSSILPNSIKNRSRKEDGMQKIDNNDSHKVTVFFLNRGKKMSRSRIEFLKNAILSKRTSCRRDGIGDGTGFHIDKNKYTATSTTRNNDQSSNTKISPKLEIVTHFQRDKHILPHYIVVDGSLTLENISSGLGFQNAEEMALLFKKHLDQIQIVTPDWIIQTKSFLEKPTMDQLWPGMFELKQKIRSTEDNCKKAGGGCSSNTWIKRKRKIDKFPAITRISATKVNNEMITRLGRLRKNNKTPANNTKLADLFQRMSNLYKEMPLDIYDEWRSYSYNAAAARLRHLDFEVCNDSLSMLGKRKGFGKKFIRQINEILNTGHCQLITEFEHDPMRLSVRNMIKIWGIGAKKAVELVKLGFTDISSVRRALDENQLDLYDNARIGVQFYEDFQEKMDRSEVKQIGDIVAAAFRKYFQDAKINIMGSYRRGNEKCGDVDVLITHPKFVKCIPEGAIDELVERLRDEGHISHHLTTVDPSHKTSLPQRADNWDDILLNTSNKAASYMGVFVSPVDKRKRRRIDIRLYPYREKAFATVYFTGNGWFNRAMRWYAKAEKGMKLDDRGLFTTTLQEKKKYSREGKRLKATSEKEIFDILGLVYKEPDERESFDAVIPKDGWKSIMKFDISLNHSEFELESKHTWIT